MSSNPAKFSNRNTKPSTSRKPPAETNFSFLTKLNSTEPHEGTELYERDLRLGRATWNKYVLPSPDFSEFVFKELFRLRPDYETLFMDLVRTPKKDIFENPRFRKHMYDRVFGKFKDIFESLDKPEELKDIMTKLGLYHAKLGLIPRHFEDMKLSVIIAVKSIMNSQNKQMQYDEEDALRKCLAYAFRISMNVMEDYHEKHPPPRTETLQDKPSRILRTLSKGKNL